MRRFLALIIVAVIAADVAVVVAPGSGADRRASAAGPGASSTVPATPAAVVLGRSSLGSILVDSRGRSLYLFEADKPGMSACSGGCVSVWPPLTAAATPRAGAGVASGKLATIARAGGQRQVSYNGHPLYTYAGDGHPGDTTGQGLNQFGAKWYVLNAAGDKIDPD